MEEVPWIDSKERIEIGELPLEHWVQLHSGIVLPILSEDVLCCVDDLPCKTVMKESIKGYLLI